MNTNSIKGTLEGTISSYHINNSSMDTAYSPQTTKRRTDIYSPRIGHLAIDLERDNIDDTMTGVHGSFIHFLQSNTPLISNAYKLEYAKSDELKYAISLATYNKEAIMKLTGFIDDFNKSKHAKYIKLSIEIVPQSWEGPAFTREIYW